jgi:phenylacetate-CoA ligase
MRLLLGKIESLVPQPLRRVGNILYGMIPLAVRYGSTFREASRFLAASQHWTAEQHQEYQIRMLKKLLSHAYENVPFYGQLYKSAGIHPDDIASLTDISILPTISKEDLRSHRDEFKASNYPASKFQYHTTGGSTGKPVGLYWEADRTVPLERAFMQRQWRWATFEMEKERSVILRGIPLRDGKLYEHLPGKQLRLSTYTLTENNIQSYLDIIADYAPAAIQAYPSSAYIVAKYILEQGGVNYPSLKVVLCGSENLYPWQREIISEAFNCRVYSWYGQSEYIALGGECEQSTDYHFYSEYGITEFIKPSGEPAQTGETGEIVATGFNNFAFPLIRFRTEDLARVSDRTTCTCGRHYPLIAQVEGRLQEMIVSRHGNLVSMTAINMHSDVFDNVHQFQFYQDTPGVIVLNLVKKETYTSRDEAAIQRAMGEKLTDQFDLRLQYVDAIELTARGKASFLVQRLPINEEWTSRQK